MIIAGSVVLGACSAGTQSPVDVANSANPASPSLSQTSDGGGVTVTAEWAGLGAGAVFEVGLDTHSVDLDGLDLADAVLRNDRGQTLSARPWQAALGGHHRAGALAFEGDEAAFFTSAEWVELVLHSVGDVPERTLRWQIGP